MIPQRCLPHNESIVFYDAIDSNQRGLCRFCAEEKVNFLIKNQLNDGEKQKAYDLTYSQTFEIIDILQLLLEHLNSLQTKIETTLKEITKSIYDEIRFVEDMQKEISFNFNLRDQQKRVNDQCSKIYQIIQYQLLNLKKVFQIDQIFTILEKLEKTDASINDHQIEQAKTLIYQPFEYRLIEKSSKNQDSICNTISFNRDASLIFYTCGKLIKISKFQNGQILPEHQQLKEHTKDVLCLNFNQKTQELVSAGEDSSIIIWNYNNSRLFVLKQKLTQHQDYVRCLIMSQKGELLISGSRDKSIKFWQKQGDNWICKSTVQTKFFVIGLSFEEIESKVIACGYNQPEILVIEQMPNQEWKISQTIKVDVFGCRLCFIDCNTFAFQPDGLNSLDFFRLNDTQYGFDKYQQTKIENGEEKNSLFPGQFIKSKGILIIKSSFFINIFRRQENDEFILQQSIKSQTTQQYGGITDDGEYMVSWNEEVKQIQVRKLEYLI